MELTIKNEKLAEHFEEQDNAMQEKNKTLNLYAMGTWIKDHPENILYGYLTSFLEISEKAGVAIDLTYDTVKNLGLGLAALYASQKNSHDYAANVNCIVKTLAAVLSYLAINEHGYWFRSTNYLNQIEAGKSPKQPLWADMVSVSVGRKNRYVDFLPCCKEAAKPGTFLVPGGMTLQMDSVIAEYKKLTGVNLAKYEIANVFIN